MNLPMVDRRTFMLDGGALASLALSPPRAFTEEHEDVLKNQLSQWIAKIIEEYSAQGIHRAVTEVDNQSDHYNLPSIVRWNRQWRNALEVGQ